MLFVIIGLVLIGLNLADVGPIGRWNWEFFGDLWKFCVPFVLAIALVDLVRQVGPQQAPRDGADGRPEEGPPPGEPGSRSAWTRGPGARRRSSARRLAPARPRRGDQSPSSTAPRLAVEAFFANLASTPRV